MIYNILFVQYPTTFPKPTLSLLVDIKLVCSSHVYIINK